jgi:ADP-ribose pyrophosphatase YjhB (NUDIX family)
MGRLILWLWRVAPLPGALRWWLVRALNTRYIVAASAVVFDAEGRLLLLRHTYRPRYPWGLPGGWLRGAERAEAGLAREIAEETGWRATVGPVVYVCSGERRVIELVFACAVTGGPFRPSAEVAAATFYGYDELPPGIAPDALRLITWAFAHRSAIRALLDPAGE